MKIVKNPPPHQWESIFERPKLEQASLKNVIAEVFDQVEREKDQALYDYTERFDGVKLSQLTINKNELEHLSIHVSDELVQALEVAYKNISTFHQAQLEKPESITTQLGVTCWRRSVAIDTVGFYIPGGSAPLFSSLMMLAIPAKIAGSRKIIICTPPQKGEYIVHPAIAWTALKCGIDTVYTVGGSQAIAAMSLGTESIEKCYKIFGPGNQYVTAAKEYAQEFHTAIDMPAGPSEVMVVADQSARPAFVAADLLSQAEHGPDSQVILLTDDEKMIDSVSAEVRKQLDALPRKEIAVKALEFSRLILTKKENFTELINLYAPEHLILQLEDTDAVVSGIRNAGSVFIGHYTPESAGDYASGTNHTLPTDGYAHMYSGVSVDSFVKKITFQEITEEGIRNLGPTIETLAENEELFGHKNAVTLRLEALKNK